MTLISIVHPFTVACVLPAAHGKSTLASSLPWLLDSALVYESPEELRRLRAAARQNDNWEQFDQDWALRIRHYLDNSDFNVTVIVVPRACIADLADIPVVASLILPCETITHVLSSTKKSRENALESREKVLRDNVRLHNVDSHESIRNTIITINETVLAHNAFLLDILESSDDD
jgi:hypothetical protein